MVEEEMEEDW